MSFEELIIYQVFLKKLVQFYIFYAIVVDA
jgi:hypothetical protein